MHTCHCLYILVTYDNDRQYHNDERYDKIAFPSHPHYIMLQSLANIIKIVKYVI